MAGQGEAASGAWQHYFSDLKHTNSRAGNHSRSALHHVLGACAQLTCRLMSGQGELAVTGGWHVSSRPLKAVSAARAASTSSTAARARALCSLNMRRRSASEGSARKEGSLLILGSLAAWSQVVVDGKLASSIRAYMRVFGEPSRARHNNAGPQRFEGSCCGQSSASNITVRS